MLEHSALETRRFSSFRLTTSPLFSHNESDTQVSFDIISEHWSGRSLHPKAHANVVAVHCSHRDARCSLFFSFAPFEWGFDRLAAVAGRARQAASNNAYQAAVGFSWWSVVESLADAKKREPFFLSSLVTSTSLFLYSNAWNFGFLGFSGYARLSFV